MGRSVLRRKQAAEKERPGYCLSADCVSSHEHVVQWNYIWPGHFACKCVPFRSPTLECSFADMHTVATWLRGKNMQTCDVFFLNLNYLINE